MIEAASLEVRHGRPDEPDGVHDVDLEADPPVLLGVGDREGTDVGHDHVESAECFGRLLHPCRECFAVAYVDRRAGDFAVVVQSVLCRRDLLGVARAERDDCALIEEGLDDGPSDATGAAGYEDAFAAELQIHWLGLL